MRSPRSVPADPGEGNGSPTLRIPPAFFAKLSRSMSDPTRAPVFRVFPGKTRNTGARVGSLIDLESFAKKAGGIRRVGDPLPSPGSAGTDRGDLIPPMGGHQPVAPLPDVLPR